MLGSAANESVSGPAAGLTETTITQATRPLADAGWKQTIEGRHIRWEAPAVEATGIQAVRALDGASDDSFASQVAPAYSL